MLAYRLLELSPIAPAFEQRQDARLVGRKRELAALRRTLKRAVDGSAVRVAVVVGSPGVGKSRLAAELTRRAKGVTTLWGRCLSYGEGITYWPLREVLDRAGASEERDAVLAALDAETPPPAPELAWLFRQFCEASAREKPLVLVFDDVHWAEPTFLELVEHLADKGTGPISVVCLAREELLEERPAFLEGRANVDRIVLDALSADETDALLEGLGGTTLESDQRARIAEAAEGNPLFLEQLLALALEGGLAERALPETIQALLAARLDRLGPGERAVLERGAVVGKEFTPEDVVALLDPDAAPTADTHLRTLAERGFVRPRGDGAVRLPARARAGGGLSRRRRSACAPSSTSATPTGSTRSRRISRTSTSSSATTSSRRIGCGPSSANPTGATEGLAEDAGRRLGAAGFRALKRGDMSATVGTARPCDRLASVSDEARHELLCELGIAQYSAGQTDASSASFFEAIAGAEAAGLRRVELRARIEAAYLRLLTEPEGAARDLLTVAESAVPAFEALGDDRSLARAWLLIGYVRGGIHGNHAAWQQAEERALVYYRRTAFPTRNVPRADRSSDLLGADVGFARHRQVHGASRRRDAIGFVGRAAVIPYLGGLHAQVGHFSHARALIAEAEANLRRARLRYCEWSTAATVRADVELLAVDLAAAEQTLREQCEHLERIRPSAPCCAGRPNSPRRCSGKAASTRLRSGLWCRGANAASDDRSTQLILGRVEAKLLARGGRFTRLANSRRRSCGSPTARTG